MEITGTVQRQAWADGALPPVEQIRPGLWSIPVPIPINPLRYVTVYALRLPDDGVALVDAGWDTPEAWQGLVEGLAAAGYQVEDVRAVLVTHIHPDHYGLAGRVRERSGAWIALHAEDARLLRERYREVDDLRDHVYEQLLRAGAPGDEAQTLAASAMGVRPFVAPTEPDVLLADGEPVPIPGWRLTAVWTPGHSPGHLCFYDSDQQVLLSGDHVLPRISPNITVHAQQRPNPLSDFLDGLRKVRALDVDEVLPAHEYRFRGLATRVDHLIEHHGERLDELADLVTRHPGLPAWDLAQRLTWSRPWEEIQGHVRRIALGETLAHLVMLQARGRIAEDGDEPARWYPSAR